MTNATLSETIAQSLATDIIDGKLKAGDRLDEQSLAERFRVSRSPVRDALRHLATTHLIEYAPRRGFSVTQIDPAKLQDMYDALSEIEALCARFCALRSSATERVALERVHAQAKLAAAKVSSETYAALNEDFHRIIYAGAHNRTLETVVLDVRQRLGPFRSRFFFQRARMESSIEEHEAILKAIVAQDPDKAAAAMRLHTAQTASNVIQLSQQPAGGRKPAQARKSVRR
jgi:DNA-binding GntR family transcriptional regulator